MFCGQCGTEAATDDRFCRSCGRELARPGSATPATAPPTSSQPASFSAFGTPEAPGTGWNYRSPAAAPPQGVWANNSPTPIRQPNLGAIVVAPGGRRVGAFLIDVFLMVVMFFAVAIPVMAIREASSGVDWDYLTEAEQDRVMGSIFGIWGIGYFLGTWALNATGASLGKRIFDLRIVREDLEPPGIGVGLGRTLAAWLSWPIVGLGFLWSFWEGHAQTWHDKMASTYVVRRDSIPRRNQAAARSIDRDPGSSSLH